MFVVSVKGGNLCASHTYLCLCDALCVCIPASGCPHGSLYVVMRVFYVYPSLRMHTSGFVGMCLGTEACFSLRSVCPCLCL